MRDNRMFIIISSAKGQSNVYHMEGTGTFCVGNEKGLEFFSLSI